MKDVYLRNKKTGELKPSMKVFREYYRSHKGVYDTPFDEWEETKIEVDNSNMPIPDFTKSVKRM